MRLFRVTCKYLYTSKRAHSLVHALALAAAKCVPYVSPPFLQPELTAGAHAGNEALTPGRQQHAQRAGGIRCLRRGGHRFAADDPLNLLPDQLRCMLCCDLHAPCSLQEM